MGIEGKKRRGRPPKNPFATNNGIGHKSNYGLVGLELSALRKSFNGHTKYDFDDFLANSIPEQYSIEVINDQDEMNKLIIDEKLKVYDVADIRKGTFDELKNSLKDKFQVNLVDHERIKGPSKVFHVAGIDPLDDCLYERSHEKLSRREKKFTSIDRDRMLTEVDNSIELLSLLGIEIKKSLLNESVRNYIVEDHELSDEQIFRLSHLLGTITAINDPTNAIEMVLKYRLTVREIRMFLLNFFKIKTLESMMKKEVLRLQANVTNTFIEPITENNIEKLREKRLISRNKRMGKIVSVKFKDGVELLIDPICEPKVVINNVKTNKQ